MGMSMFICLTSLITQPDLCFITPWLYRLEERKDMRALICLNVVEGSALSRSSCFFWRGSLIPYSIAVQEGKIRQGKAFKGCERETDLLLSTFNNWTRPKAGEKGGRLDDEDLVDAIRALYAHEDFQDVLKRRAEYQIHDGWRYFSNKLLNNPGWPTWGGPDWTPSEDDLLHSRIRTTGKQQLNFEVNGTKYQLIDVGGQQSERRKFFTLFSVSRCVEQVAG